MTPARPSLNPPKAVREIAETLERAGFETWCVGGAVRDALLGHRHLDWDLATAATPQEVRSLFRRTVPVGVEFGTIGVLDRAGVMHEVTTFRRDVRTDGRHAEVVFGVSLDEDLARRDFTINAIAYSPRRSVLHDPFDGQADLRRGIVRAVGVPEQRMREDRLRALRALRFASRFEFEIERATWEAIVSSAPHLTRLSAERVKQELEKTMEQVRCPSRALALWRLSGALETLVPALARQPDVALRAPDYVGLPDATQRPERASLRLLVRLGVLFWGLPPREVRNVTRALRFSNKDVDQMVRLAELWNLLHADLRSSLSASMSDAAVRRLISRTGRTLLAAFLRGAAARWAAERAYAQDAPTRRSIAMLHARAVPLAWRAPVSIGDLAVDGGDLLDAGVLAGPRVGEILTLLLEWVLDDPARNTREQLLERVREIAASGGT